MWNPFKKKPVVETIYEIIKEKPWTYGITFDNVPDNQYNIGSSHCICFDYNSNTPFPRIGETIYIRDDMHTDLYYTGVVNEIFYNYDLHWIVITCKCNEVEYSKIN